MKEIVVISGKGGTGKTSITAAFAQLAGEKLIVADCDVDAADMHLLLNPDFKKKEDFYSGFYASIDKNKCIACDACFDVCRFNAINRSHSEFSVIKMNCEGCGYCEKICPADAISMKDNNVGEWYISKTKFKNYLVHAKLGIAAENSGKLVAKVKNEAKALAEKNNIDFILVDGSPGIGCPVVSSLSGADFVVFVTEPTITGIHDLKRVHELVKKFNIDSGCIINKSDLNEKVTEEIKDFLRAENIFHITDIPYDPSFSKAIINGKTIIEYDNGILKEELTNSWNKIIRLLNNK